MQRSTALVLGLTAALTIAFGAAAGADTIDFDFLASTPVGSWQEREQVTDDGKKQTVTVMRIKYLGDEERNGESFSWIENEIANFKVKKGARKPQGEPMVVKFLMRKSTLESDVMNALGNFNDLATEVIMQTGNAEPMRIKGAGSTMGGLAQAIGLQIEYTFARDGGESVSVPAGTFSCARYRGQGSTTAKVIVTTITVESSSTQWLSQEVPFGVVKVVSDDSINGKPQRSETTLVSFGMSGATSRITGEPQDLEMPSLGGILGG